MDVKEILKDLKEFSDDGATEYGYEMPLSEVREVIEALERTRWIPVSERLPDIFLDVLVLNFGYVEIAYLNVKAKWIQKGVQDGYLDGVTHWMPLPELPEVE